MRTSSVKFPFLFVSKVSNTLCTNFIGGGVPFVASTNCENSYDKCQCISMRSVYRVIRESVCVCAFVYYSVAVGMGCMARHLLGPRAILISIEFLE